MGMVLIGKEVSRSSSTVRNHINRHNENIERVGYCDVCKRVKGEHVDISV